MAFTCPVCGYNQLKYPPENETICPSCYTEFGYDDATRSHSELRQEWLSNGARWEGSNVMAAPAGWDPYEQLKHIGALQERPVKSSTNLGVVDLVSSRTIVGITIAAAVVHIVGRQYGIRNVLYQTARITTATPIVKIHA